MSTGKYLLEVTLLSQPVTVVLSVTGVVPVTSVVPMTGYVSVMGCCFPCYKCRRITLQVLSLWRRLASHPEGSNITSSHFILGIRDMHQLCAVWAVWLACLYLSLEYTRKWYFHLFLVWDWPIFVLPLNFL